MTGPRIRVTVPADTAPEERLVGPVTFRHAGYLAVAGGGLAALVLGHGRPLLAALGAVLVVAGGAGALARPGGEPLDRVVPAALRWWARTRRGPRATSEDAGGGGDRVVPADADGDAPAVRTRRDARAPRRDARAPRPATPAGPPPASPTEAATPAATAVRRRRGRVVAALLVLVAGLGTVVAAAWPASGPGTGRSPVAPGWPAPPPGGSGDPGLGVVLVPVPVPADPLGEVPGDLSDLLGS